MQLVSSESDKLTVYESWQLSVRKELLIVQMGAAEADGRVMLELPDAEKTLVLPALARSWCDWFK